MKTRAKVLQYLLEDKESAILATVIGNLLMGSIFLFSDLENLTKVPQIQYSVI